MPEQLVGTITHYFGKIGVGVVAINNGELKVGDRIHLKGHTTDFEQTVDSLQVEKQTVDKIGVGESAGLKVAQPVKEHDAVYLVT